MRRLRTRSWKTSRKMPLHLQFRRYRLPLRRSLRTAREVWTEREGLLVRVERDDRQVGYGEVAPIPAFGTESVDAAEAALRSLGEWPAEASLASVPANLCCVRHALHEALAAAEASPDRDAPAPAESTADASAAYRAVAALLPAGPAALAQIAAKLESGFRTFKWKVGAGDVADELGLLDDLCAELPAGAKLRLDANGAWRRRDAERWLERCAERPIEFVEQPCFAPKRDGETAWRRAEDTLRGLADDYPTPIALDESLVTDADADRWLSEGWRGWFVVKPSLLADCAQVIARLAAARRSVVFSSALETAVGARSALRHAFAWPGERKALGFGVWPLFSDPRFDGPALAPFVRAEDVARIDPEAVWNALT